MTLEEGMYAFIYLPLLAFNATTASWSISIGWFIDVAAVTLCNSHPKFLTPSEFDLS